ncbi:MAG: 2-dehydro-3-deoxygalactonokinase [Pseudomonadota bacterium]
MRPLIALDWGTTHLRAARFEGDRVAESRQSSDGIQVIANRAFARALEQLVGDWLDAAPDSVLLASGMIGSRQGWVEADYLPCPAPLDDLVGNLCAVPFRESSLHIVPGLTTGADEQFPDVMRGEEVQVLGTRALGAVESVFVLPGTHSKWVRVRGDTVDTFTTFMTGEVYGALREHTILGRMMTGGNSLETEAFDDGLAASRVAGGPGDLLSRMFSTRTLGLFERLSADGAGSYLSGLLIGSEVAAMCQQYDADAIAILGSNALGVRYARAFQWYGLSHRIETRDVASRGLYRIATAAGLLE